MLTKEFLYEELVSKGKSPELLSKEIGYSKTYIVKRRGELKVLPTTLDKYKDKEFGQLTVIGLGDAKYTFKCKCVCGKVIELKSTAFVTGNTKSCGCSWLKYGSNHAAFRGYGEIGKTLWTRYQNNAYKRELEFSISIEYAWELFLSQNRLCALTDMPLVFSERKRDDTLTTASIDRRDSTKGYVEGNIWWVHKTINMMKNTLPEKDFIEFCTKVANKNKGV